MKKSLYKENIEHAKKIQEIELELCQKQLNKIKIEFENAFSDDKRQIYVKMSPVDVFHCLLELIEEANEFDDDNDQEYLSDLLNELKNSDLHKYLLNLAIFLGTVEEPKKHMISNISANESVEEAPTTVNNNQVLHQTQQQPKVPINKLCTILYNLINESDGLFHMFTLTKIQQDICRHFKIDERSDFTALGHGDFIKFLKDHQKTIGSNLEFYLFNADSCGGIKRTELSIFVHHLLNNGVRDEKLIEKAVKYHFNLQTLKQIGFHNINQLCDRVRKQNQNSNTTIQYVRITLKNKLLTLFFLVMKKSY